VRWALFSRLLPIIGVCAQLVLLPSWELIPKSSDFLATLITPRGFTTEVLPYLTVRDNEHVFVIPALIHVVHTVATGGRSWYLSLFVLVELTALSILLPRLLAGRRGATGVSVISALALFGPGLIISVVEAELGVAFVTPVVLSVGSLVAYCVYMRRALALGLGGLAVLSHGAGLPVWLALAAAAAAQRRWRDAAVFTAVLVAAGAMLIVTLPTVNEHPLNLTDAPRLLSFAGGVVGAGLAQSATGAALAGIAGACIALFSCRSADAPATPGTVGVLVYLGGVALLIALGRSAAFDPIESRYAVLTATFWAVVGGRLALAWPGAGTMAAAAIIGQLYWTAVPGIGWAAHNWPLSPLVGESLRVGVFDPDLLRRYAPDPKGLWAMREPWRRVGRVPFNRDVESPPRRVSRMLESTGEGSPLRGELTHVVQLAGAVRVEGWLTHPEREIAELWLVDGKGLVCGRGILVRPPRTRLGAASAWGGYGRCSEGLAAVVRLEWSDTYWRLPARRELR
jgi:hypothetical protein